MAINTWRLTIRAASQLERSMYTRLFDRDRRNEYEIGWVETYAGALDYIRANRGDLLLLHLTEPDPAIEQALRQFLSARPDLPTAVVYGGEADGFEALCLQAGASDVMHEKRLNAVSARLLVSSVIGQHRMNDARLAERRATAYELVSTHIVNGWLTATKGWNPLLRQSRPDKFKETVDAYAQVLVEWVRNRREGKRQSRAPLRHIATTIQRLGGTPGDVVDIHTFAVAQVVSGMDEAKARGAAMMSHPLAIDIVGRLDVVKDQAPGSRASMRRTSALTVNRRPSDVGGVRRTSDVGAARRVSETMGRRDSDLTGRRTSSITGVRSTSSYGRRRSSGIGERRKSDMVVGVTGRKDES